MLFVSKPNTGGDSLREKCIGAAPALVNCRQARALPSHVQHRSNALNALNIYDNMYVENSRQLFYKEAMICVSFETFFGRLAGDVQGPPGSVRRDERCSEGRMDFGRNARLQGKFRLVFTVSRSCFFVVIAGVVAAVGVVFRVGSRCAAFEVGSSLEVFPCFMSLFNSVLSCTWLPLCDFLGPDVFLVLKVSFRFLLPFHAAGYCDRHT